MIDPYFRVVRPAAALLFLAISVLSRPVLAADGTLPHIVKQGRIAQLTVDKQPFLVLGVWVSEAALAGSDQASVWAQLVHLNANTALVAIRRDQVESSPAQLNFGRVDDLLHGAASNHLHLILQWSDRQPEAAPPQEEGRSNETLAFASLMRHLATVDSKHIVLAVQVGRTNAAGDGLESLGKVAAAGKGEYDIPMYVTCVLDDTSSPSHDRSIAKPLPASIDMLALQLHASHFAKECSTIAAENQPLFLVQAEDSPVAPAELLYAIGKCNALGIAVNAPADPASLHGIARAYSAISGIAPAILHNQGRETLAAFAFGPGALNGNDQDAVMKTARLTLTIHPSPPPDPEKHSPANRDTNGIVPADATTAGLIISATPTEFFVLHSGLGVTVSANDPSLGTLALGFQEVGSFVDGKWKRYERINGDENDHDRRIESALNTPWRDLHVAYYQRP